MITGFNTNVKYGDTTYHVQTEDKGVKNPLIESLIYVKGAIVDSHRTPYRDLLQSEAFKDSDLKKIVDYQHRQIVSAIKKGKFQKGMELRPYVDGSFIFQVGSSKRASDLISPAKKNVSEQKVEQVAADLHSADKPSHDRPSEKTYAFNLTTGIEATPGPGSTLVAKQETIPSPFSLEHTQYGRLNDLQTQQGIEIRLEGSRNFMAGSHVELRLTVESRQSKTKLENVQVMIKVIGTSLEPRLYTGKTDRLGRLALDFNLPNYSVGSAALIIQASTSLGNSEIKYLIHKR